MRFVLAAAALLPTAAFAQPQCAPLQVVVEYLGGEHNEAPFALFKEGDKTVILFVSLAGTWTKVERGEKEACIVSDGTDFRPIRWVEPPRRS